MITDRGAEMSSAASGCWSSNNRKAGDVSDQFPAGLRVLVVDDDPTCLKILEKMLQKCSYKVTACTRAADALSMLREKKDGFDIVISDVHMPDMDGFKLLEHIGLEMDLPVIMMSADDSKDVVMKGVIHGAHDYLIKPVRTEAIKNIWQHVVRKKRNELKDLDHSGSMEDSDKNRKPLDDADYASSANEGSWKSSKRRMDAKDEEDEGEEREDSSSLKKPRVVWSVELHQQFVAAVNQLGIDKAVPKKILELMNVPGLTRENVASHLQKYRLYLRRLSGVSRHQGGVNPPFVGAQEAAFSSVSSLDELDLQVLAVSGQFPPQSLVTLPAGLGRTTTNTGMGMSIVDQRNLFNSERQIATSPTIRYGPGQQLSNKKQLNLLHGLPTTIEPEQLHLHPSVQSFGDIGLQVSEGIPGFLNLPTSVRTGSSSHGDTIHGHQNGPLMMQMSQVRQRMFSPEIAGQVLGRNRTILNGRGTSSEGTCMNNPSYGTVSQTSTSSLDFPINPVTELPGNGFSLPSAELSSVSGLPPSTGCLEGINNATNVKGGPRGSFIPSYDLFNELDQSKIQNWDLQNVNLAYGAAQPVNSIQSSLDFCPSVMGHQSFTAIQKNGQNGNMSNIGKGMLPLRQEDGHGSLESIAQLNNNLLVDDSFRIKAESNLSSENAIITEHFVQDDLMNVLFKQQPGAEPADCDFNFDGYPMDNIRV